MKNTTKFAVSMPQKDFKALESDRRRSGQTRSAFILEAVRAWLGRDEESEKYGKRENIVNEDSVCYGSDKPESKLPKPPSFLNSGEIRKRAIAAAGRFRSEKGNLALKHDEVLADAFVDTNPGNKSSGSPESRGKE